MYFKLANESTGNSGHKSSVYFKLANESIVSVYPEITQRAVMKSEKGGMGW